MLENKILPSDMFKIQVQDDATFIFHAVEYDIIYGGIIGKLSE